MGQPVPRARQHGGILTATGPLHNSRTTIVPKAPKQSTAYAIDFSMGTCIIPHFSNWVSRRESMNRCSTSTRRLLSLAALTASVLTASLFGGRFGARAEADPACGVPPARRVSATASDADAAAWCVAPDATQTAALPTLVADFTQPIHTALPASGDVSVEDNNSSPNPFETRTLAAHATPATWPPSRGAGGHAYDAPPYRGLVPSTHTILQL